MTCNRCYEPLRPDQAVEPSFSGRYPYVAGRSRIKHQVVIGSG